MRVVGENLIAVDCVAAVSTGGAAGSTTHSSDRTCPGLRVHNSRMSGNNQRLVATPSSVIDIPHVVEKSPRVLPQHPALRRAPSTFNVGSLPQASRDCWRLSPVLGTESVSTRVQRACCTQSSRPPT
eukprot:m.1036877 g.1036877  ORF g.1036877 m.1036877 type:complete len:127 (-) comp24140_c1_seq25:296-676(-)